MHIAKLILPNFFIDILQYPYVTYISSLLNLLLSNNQLSNMHSAIMLLATPFRRKCEKILIKTRLTSEEYADINSLFA